MFKVKLYDHQDGTAEASVFYETPAGWKHIETVIGETIYVLGEIEKRLIAEKVSTP